MREELWSDTAAAQAEPSPDAAVCIVRRLSKLIDEIAHVPCAHRASKNRYLHPAPERISCRRVKTSPPRPNKKQLHAICNHGLQRHRLHSRGTAPRIGRPCGVCPSPGQHAEHPPGEETKSTPPRSVFRPAAQAVRVLTLCECES